MSRQLLFYDLIIPVSSGRHRDWSVKPPHQFSFAAKANSVPLMSAEFVAAAQEYPIVFTTAANGVAMPLVVLGYDADKSLYVKPDGSWDARYVPAFVRRYPFVFSASDDGQTLTLCIDEGYQGFSRAEAGGERLFGEDGDRTPYLERMLEFVNQYQAEHQRTLAYGKILAELDILELSEAKFAFGGGEKKTLRGFHCVSREKLKALDPNKITDIFANDLLELIYLHLYSLRNFEGLISRAATEQAPDRSRAN
jgi:hypothetical protein